MSQGGAAGARALRLWPACAALSVLALAGAAAQEGLLPAALSTAATAALLAGGAALPLLAAWTPAQPSALKLATFALALSPPLVTALYALLHAAVGATHAVAGALALCALLQVAGVRRRVELAPLSRAALGALALAVASAALVALLSFRGSAARASYHGLLHSALLLAADRGVPPENPYLAGTPLAYYWLWHAQGALVARGLGVAPTVALALSNVWAAALMPLALHQLAAALFRDGKRELAGVLLALFGLNALGGWAWLAHGAPWSAPASSAALLDSLRPATDPAGTPLAFLPAWDARLAFGPSKLANPSSYPAALALLCASLAAAAHALRHGARPWVGATALCAGASLAVNPIDGGVAVAVVAAAALAFAPGVRLRVLAALAACALPGALLALGAVRGYGGSLAQLDPGGARALGAAAPVLLLLPPAAFALRGAADRRVAGLAVTAALLPLALAALIVLPYDNQYKLVRIAAVPLGLLAAGGLFALWEARGARRALGALLAAALVPGALAVDGLGLASYLAFARVELPLVERPLALAPRAADGEGADVARAWEWLQRASRVLERPVLVADVLGEPTTYGGVAFSDPVQNLQGHEGAAFSGAALLCDVPSQALDARAPELARRLALVRRVFAEPGAPEPGELALPELRGRPLLVLVTARDRGYKPDVLGDLERAGFGRAFAAPGAVVLAERERLAALAAAGLLDPELAAGGEGEAARR